MTTWRYDDLVREGVSLIPAHAPGWTNHNASDPGITLVELLAYVTELLAYRLGRVTPQARLEFLRLLLGRPDACVPLDQVDDTIARTVNAMGQAECAVTADDFVQLAVEAAGAAGCTVDALCLPATDLSGRGGRAGRGSDRRSHVSVVLFPDADLTDADLARVCRTVEKALAPRCLLGTRVQVTGPTPLHVGLRCRIVLRRGVAPQPVLDAVQTCLRAPRSGAAVRLSEITEAIDNMAGVDHVDQVVVMALSPDRDRLADARSAVGLQIALHSTPGLDTWLGMPLALDPQRLQRDDAGRLSAVLLKPWEVAHLHLVAQTVEGADALATGGRDAWR